jgi:hypothetical protein
LSSDLRQEPDVGLAQGAGERREEVPDLESAWYQGEALGQGTVPVGTTPDEGGVVPAPETTSHSQPSQLVPTLNFARQALDASSNMLEDEENKERAENGLSRENKIKKRDITNHTKCVCVWPMRY